MVCVKEGCPWWVHAYKGKWKDYWECSIVTQHTYHLPRVQKSHRNLTSQYIANEMYGMIVANLSFEPKSIIRHIQEKYKYTISYGKAWSAKQKVLEMRFGMFEAAYDNISRLLAVICQRNSGSYYDMKSVDRGQGPPFKLQRAFFSLGPCINAL
jgi:GTP1/Obg family GTP-binding protein